MDYRPHHIIPVSTLDDPHIADYRAIRDRDLIRQKGLFIVEGENPVLRLLASRYKTASLLVSDKRLARIAPFVPADIPLYTAPERILEQAPGFSFNRGVIACGIRRSLPSLPDLLHQIKPPATLVVCAGIADAENLGQIIRSSAALGAAGILLGSGTIDPFYRRVVRVSMGALFSLPLAGSDDPGADLRRLKEAGFRLFATHLSPAATPLRQVHPAPLNAILLGSEGSGLPAELAEVSDERITIPMQEGVDSLNVAAAAAIFLHHFTR